MHKEAHELVDTHTHLTTQTLSRWWRTNHSHRKWGQDARERERERDDDPDRGRRGLEVCAGKQIELWMKN